MRMKGLVPQEGKKTKRTEKRPETGSGGQTPRTPGSERPVGQPRAEQSAARSAPLPKRKELSAPSAEELARKKQKGLAEPSVQPELHAPTPRGPSTTTPPGPGTSAPARGEASPSQGWSFRHTGPDRVPLVLPSSRVRDNTFTIPDCPEGAVNTIMQLHPRFSLPFQSTYSRYFEEDFAASSSMRYSERQQAMNYHLLQAFQHGMLQEVISGDLEKNEQDLVYLQDCKEEAMMLKEECDLQRATVRSLQEELDLQKAKLEEQEREIAVRESRMLQKCSELARVSLKHADAVSARRNLEGQVQRAQAAHAELEKKIQEATAAAEKAWAEGRVEGIAEAEAKAKAAAPAREREIAQMFIDAARAECEKRHPGLDTSFLELEESDEEDSAEQMAEAEATGGLSAATEAPPAGQPAGQHAELPVPRPGGEHSAEESRGAEVATIEPDA